MCPQHKLNTCFEEHELNLKLLNLIDPRKTRHIGITGGEPTLLNEKLFELIKICRNKFPDISLSLLTNGRKFKELSFAKKIAEINHPNLIICISLNADTDTEHDYIMGASGSFNETVEGLYNLALLRQKVEIRTVIHSFNYKRLPKLAEFIYHNFPFVVHVALMGMEVTGLSLENIETLWVDPYDYLNELREAVLYLDRRLINVSVYNLPLCLLTNELWRFARRSISNWKNIYLPICKKCILQEECCGLFETSGDWQSKHIHPQKQI